VLNIGSPDSRDLTLAGIFAKILQLNEAHPQQAAGYRSLNTQFRSKLRGIRPTLD
jgi:hypothetical protein